MTDTPMTVGRRYRIELKRQPSLTPVMAVLDFVDEVNNFYVMSGNPTLGLQQIPCTWVIHIEEVSDKVSCRMNPPNEDD